MSTLRQAIPRHTRKLFCLIRLRRCTLRFWGCNRRRKPNKQERREKDSRCLPTGVLFQIFARLPFRDIARLRVLSKSWHARLHSVYLFELLLQHDSVDLSRCALALCCKPSKTIMDPYMPRNKSLQLFFPPLRTWFHLPLYSALSSKLGYGYPNAHFNDQRRYISARVWGAHTARGLMCSLISLDNERDGQHFTVKARHHRIVVSNYLTGKFIARISLPPQCLLCMTSKMRTFVEPHFILQISPDACCSEEYTIILADVAAAPPGHESYQYTGIYSSKLGSWRSSKDINSIINVDTEIRCFENADLLFVEDPFVLAYSVESGKWFRSNVGFTIEGIEYHAFIWRGKVYLADALVEWDFSDSHNDNPPVEVRGFRVCQLRTRNSGDGLYWHEISTTPTEWLKGIQNMFKGPLNIDYVYMSLENNGNVIYMAVFDDPASLCTPPPPMYNQHCSYVWTPILYDVESHTWSFLPNPKNENRVLKLVHF